MLRCIVFCLVTTAIWASTGCGDDGHYIMTEEWLVEPSGERYLGGGCTSIQECTNGGTGGGSAGGTPALRFAVELEGVDDGVRVVVIGGNTSIERVFDESWLRGEKPAETLEVKIDDAHTYRVRLSGGLQCVRPSEPAKE
ncbi:MAG TPA: hypothetical protein VM925_02960 [Labilithrix sp.]|jgi:hypothetical protein|nr:hypothetical protein [Labilithrix sp.]